MDTFSSDCPIMHLSQAAMTGGASLENMLLTHMVRELWSFVCACMHGSRKHVYIMII